MEQKYRKYTERGLEMARAAREEARREFNATATHSKAWMQAEENLNFWQSKVAMIEAFNKSKETP